MTSKLTWTFGIRATHNSNPLNPHDAVARLSGSFDSISHDVNQPLSAGDSDRSRKYFRFDAARDSSAQDRDCLADRAENRPAKRIRSVQRPLARKRCRSCRRESAVLANLSGRLARNRRRDGDRAGCAGQRDRCDRRRQSDLQQWLRQWPTLLRIAALSIRKYLPATGGDYRRAGWKTARALFHGVEPRPGTADRQHHQSARPVCRHARREPALHDAGERLSDRVSGLLCAVSLRPARSIRDSEPSRNSAPAPTATTTASKRQPRSGLGMDCRFRRTTPGATASTRFRTAGSCRSPREEFFRRFPAIFSAIAAPAIMMCGTTSPPATVYELPVKLRGRARRRAERMAGIGIGVLAQRHSFLGPERALFREWKRHREWQRSAIRERGSRRASLRAQSDSRRHAAGHDSVAEPGCFRFQRSIRARARAPAAILQRTASLAISDATPCAVPISPGAICISRNGSL